MENESIVVVYFYSLEILQQWPAPSFLLSTPATIWPSSSLAIATNKKQQQKTTENKTMNC